MATLLPVLRAGASQKQGYGEEELYAGWAVKDAVVGISSATQLPIGWYFEDEHEEFRGPYTSKEDAEDARDTYYQELHGDD